MRDLKPCPFCGSEARLTYSTNNPRQPYVTCDTPKCPGCNPYQWHYHTEEEAIEAWNRRTERKWIPATEKLPEEEKDVLVSVHFDGYKSKIVNLPQSDYVEIANQIEGVWSSLSDEYKVVEVNHHVIAWMPLPEPWRGE